MLNGEIVEEVEEGAALLLELRGEFRDQEGGRDAVLVAYAVGVDAVAEGLLVAVAQALDAGDPLEAGERLLVRQTRFSGDPPEEGGRHDRLGERPLRAASDEMRGEQRADLVAAQHPPLPVVLDGDGAAVGVGVVGDDQVRVGLAGLREGQVHGARLFRVGEGDGGEVRVGLGLFGDEGGPGKPARAKAARRVSLPTPCNAV